MIKIEIVSVSGAEAAFRGMRNPMNSWSKSDSGIMFDEKAEEFVFVPGANDVDLAHRLYEAGAEHRKYLRMMHIQMDVVANQVWWSEFDTYKVGTTRNSCSKMHKIHAKEFTIDDFSHEGITECGENVEWVFSMHIRECEHLRVMYNETHEKKYWRALIEMLPESYNMRATIDFDYETAIRIIRQREGHKMEEWHAFVNVLKRLPYMDAILKGIYIK